MFSNPSFVKRFRVVKFGPCSAMNKIDPDHLEFVGEVFEEGTRVDDPESVLSHEDFPQTNSKINFI